MKTFIEWIEENKTFNISFKKLYGSPSKIKEVLKDLEEKKLSYSAGSPVIVSRLDSPKGYFYVMDGYHRIIEAIFRRESSISASIDKYVSRIERTGGGYNEMISRKVLIVDLVKV